MHKVAIFGAGKIGEAICGLLSVSGRYQLKICDIDNNRAESVAAIWKNCEGYQLDTNNQSAMQKLLEDCDAVLAALPFFCHPPVAKAAILTNTHYFDLTEDVGTTDQIEEMARNAEICMMPQCGLAPGFVSIAAAHLANSFEKVDTVKMRVGALPIYPSNRLKYNLTWSTDGLINEYCNMCEFVHEGKKHQALPLEGYERFSLDGDEYEAFNTSGGLGTLCDTLAGKVRQLDYKSVRYPGHRDFIALLLKDLRFSEDRETLKKVLERSIAATAQDKCLIFVEARGWIKDRLIQRTYASTVYNTLINDHHFSAIQLTTAAGICAAADMVLEGKVKVTRGLVRSEDLGLMDFLKNEFGQYYKDEKALKGISV